MTTPHTHIYDEHDLCFECDKPRPKDKGSMMKRLRCTRKQAGLVEFRAWVTPAEKEALQLALEKIQH